MKLELPIISSDRLLLRLATHQDIPQVLKYFRDNKTYLTPFYPRWFDEFFTDYYWQHSIEGGILEFINNKSLRLFIFPRYRLDEVIGTVNFTDYVR